MKIQNGVRGSPAQAVEATVEERTREQAPVRPAAHGQAAGDGHGQLPEIFAVPELESIGRRWDAADPLTDAR